MKSHRTLGRFESNSLAIRLLATLIFVLAFAGVASRAAAQGYGLAPVWTGNDVKCVALNHVDDMVYVGDAGGIHLLDAASYAEVSLIAPLSLGDSPAALCSDWRRNQLAAVWNRTNFASPTFFSALYDGDTGLNPFFSISGSGVTSTTVPSVSVHSRLGLFYIGDPFGSVESISSSRIPGANLIPAVPPAGAPAVDPLTDRLYLPSGSGLQVFDANTNSYITTISGSEAGGSADIDPNRHALYHIGGVTGAVQIYDTQTLTPILLPGSSSFKKVALDRRRGLVYFLGDGVLSIFGASGLSFVASLNPATGTEIFKDLAVNNVTGEVFVAADDNGSGTLYKLAEPPPAPGQAYEAKVIGQLDWLDPAMPPMDAFSTQRINEHGQVLGEWVDTGFGPLVSNLISSFVADVDGVTYQYHNQSLELWDMNNVGQLAGLVFTDPTYVSNQGLSGTNVSDAILQDLSGSLNDLGTFGGARASALGINDLGHWSGFTRAADGSFNALWSDGVNPPTFIPGALAAGLNSIDELSGLTRPGFQAWFYSGGVANVIGSTFPDHSYAWKLNDLSQAVVFENWDVGPTIPYLWDPVSGFTNLSYDGCNSIIYGLDNLGRCVGSDGGVLDLGAWLYDPSAGMLSLGSLVQAGVNPLYEADSINVFGEISAVAGPVDPNTGNTYPGSVSTAYALEPVGQDLRGLALDNATVIGGANVAVHGKVVMRRAAGPGGETVLLSSDTPTAASVPVSVVVPAGQYAATFSVTLSAVASDVNVLISAQYGSTSQGSVLTVSAAAISSVTFNPNPLTGYLVSGTGTVTLNEPAPGSGPVTINLSCPSSHLTLDASTTVNAGVDTSANFNVQSLGVLTDTVVTVTASMEGTTQTGNLTLRAPRPSSVTLSSSSVNGGTSVSGQITIDGPAPPGYAVTLTSNNAAAQVTTPIPFATSATTANFTVTTSAVSSNQTATLTATYSGVSKTTTLTVLAPVLTSNILNPATVFVGQSSAGTVILSAPAATGGAVVTLSSSSNKVTVPPSVTVLAGKTSATYTVTAGNGSPASAVITATLNGASKPTTLTIQTPALLGLTFQNSSGTTITSAKQGTTVNLVVRLTGPVVAKTNVALSSSKPKIVPLPSNAPIAAGSSSVVITVKLGSVTASTLVTATGTYNAVNKTASLTVTP